MNRDMRSRLLLKFVIGGIIVFPNPSKDYGSEGQKRIQIHGDRSDTRDLNTDRSWSVRFSGLGRAFPVEQFEIMDMKVLRP